MPMPYTIIKRVEYLEARDQRSGRSGGWRFCNRNIEKYYNVTEGDDEEPFIKQEVVHSDIPAELPGVELEHKQNMPAYQEADTDNLSAVEEATVCALTNNDMTLPHHNKVLEVMNEAL